MPLHHKHIGHYGIIVRKEHQKGMGVTAAGAPSGTGFVQASLPFRSSNANTNSKRIRLHSNFITTCCSASKDGDNRAISSSLSSSNLISSVGKRLQSYLETCTDKNPLKMNSNTDTEWDWDRWQEHFADMEKYETLISVLKSQLDDAIESEDFQEASRLKKAIRAMMAKDTVAEVMSELEKAIEEERYLDAVRLRDDAGAGLVGWWVSLPQGEKDSYGRIVNICPGQGRFLAKSYNARQLAAAETGVPLFEIFVTKYGDLKYKQQAVSLQRSKETSSVSLPALEPLDADLLDSSKSSLEGDQKYQSLEISADVENEGDKSDNKDNMDELNRVLNYLRDRIPGIKFKVLKVIAPEGAEMDAKIFEQLIQEDEGDDESDSNESSEDEEDEIRIESDLQDDKETIEDIDFTEKHKETPFKLVIGGVLPTSSEDKAPRVVVRVPAKIEYRGRDAFIFHTEENDSQEPSVTDELDMKVAKVAAQSSSDLELSDVVKSLWKSKKIGLKEPKDIEEIVEIIKLAFIQAQKRNELSGSSMFRRLNVAEANSDLLSGIYIGTFGRQNSEVVQLRRKYGHWQDTDESPSENSKLEFFEYVEAVKLTGDLNVPAGQVTFRAKIGNTNSLSIRGIYPEELGVIARYKGQGRIARAGFLNPQWIDGELVLLNGKGGGLTEGAQLGFVYRVSEKHILVLFNRLKLQE